MRWLYWLAASRLGFALINTVFAAQIPSLRAAWGMSASQAGLVQSAWHGGYLLSLVLAASMMPVQKLPDASWQVAMGLGFISAVFDNIPLTALALKQGGYDWGFVAFAVGFGGSMIWFGSSAGVALTNMYPEGKDAIAWVKSGWHVAVAYVIGFAALLFTLGWLPNEPHKFRPAAPASAIVNPAR